MRRSMLDKICVCINTACGTLVPCVLQLYSQHSQCPSSFKTTTTPTPTTTTRHSWKSKVTQRSHLLAILPQRSSHAVNTSPTTAGRLPPPAGAATPPACGIVTLLLLLLLLSAC
jgi:hypothetical protein